MRGYKKKKMLYLGSDHGGFDLKQAIKKYLKKKNIEYKDLGPESIDNNDDYPDYALKVAQEVAQSQENKGILICGTGIGMCITANKVKGIRAALCYDKETARLSREHNDSNVLCLGGRTTKKGKALKIVDVWLKTPFSNIDRHKKRVEKMNEL